MYHPLFVLFYVLPAIAQAQSPDTYWRNYGKCSEKCKQDIYNLGLSGCPLKNSCLCTNYFWLEATARCVHERCGERELVETAEETERACKHSLTPMVISHQQFIDFGRLGYVRTAPRNEEPDSVQPEGPSPRRSEPQSELQNSQGGGNNGQLPISLHRPSYIVRSAYSYQEGSPCLRPPSSLPQYFRSQVGPIILGRHCGKLWVSLSAQLGLYFESRECPNRNLATDARVLDRATCLSTHAPDQKKLQRRKNYGT